LQTRQAEADTKEGRTTHETIASANFPPRALIHFRPAAKRRWQPIGSLDLIHVFVTCALNRAEGISSCILLP
jgi:hypothetical protein